MPSLSQRIRTFLASPTGQQLIEKGKEELAKPSTQQALRQFATKLVKRR